jgi:hypothetical protein
MLHKGSPAHPAGELYKCGLRRADRRRFVAAEIVGRCFHIAYCSAGIASFGTRHIMTPTMMLRRAIKSEHWVNGGQLLRLYVTE